MKILKASALILANTVALLLLAELASAIFFKTHQRPEVVYQYSYLTGYSYDPYIGFTSPQFPFYGNTSSKASIVITGGSTAAGVGVLDSELSYFRVLEKNLIKKNKLESNQLLNFAVPGYVSNQESATYKFHVFNLPNPPKVLISFTSFNDIYFYLFRTLPIGDHEFGFAMDYIFRKGYPSADSFSESARNSFRRTRLYGLYHYFSRPGGANSTEPVRLSADFNIPYQPESEEPTEERIQKAVKNFLDNCLSTAILAKSKGTKFVVLIQPNYYYGGKLTVNENEWFSTMPDLENWINSVKLHEASYERFYTLAISGLKKYQQQKLLEFWDYRSVLKDAGAVYLDPVHFDKVGSKIVAEKIEQDLKSIF